LRKATELINAHYPAIDERRAQAQAARLALIVFSLLHWFACLNYAVAKRTIFTEAELGERSSQSELYLRALQRALCSFVGEVRRERESRIRPSLNDGLPLCFHYCSSQHPAVTPLCQSGNTNTASEVGLSVASILVGTTLIAVSTSTIVEIMTSVAYTESRKVPHAPSTTAPTHC
jgi:hypothetical protein